MYSTAHEQDYIHTSAMKHINAQVTHSYLHEYTVCNTIYTRVHATHARRTAVNHMRAAANLLVCGTVHVCHYSLIITSICRYLTSEWKSKKKDDEPKLFDQMMITCPSVSIDSTGTAFYRSLVAVKNDHSSRLYLLI